MASAERVGGWLAALAPAPRDPCRDVGAVVEIPVVYDGPDLAAVAAACSMAVDEVVARHRAGSYVAAFCGFAPGFAYLTGLDPALHLPRRADAADPCARRRRGHRRRVHGRLPVAVARRVAPDRLDRRGAVGSGARPSRR